jgi:hypothetical protein
MKTEWNNDVKDAERNTLYLVTDASGAVGIGQHLGNDVWACAHAGSHVIAFAPLPEAYVAPEISQKKGK